MTNPDNVGGLLPCPFCGESADFQRSSLPEDGEICFPLCTACGAKLDDGPIGVGWYANEAAASAVWNRRELCRAAPAGGDVPSWRNIGSAIDAKALATATEIAMMWGNDMSQFVSRIQVAVIDAMRWMGEADFQRSTHHVHRGPESLPCYCAGTSDHSIGQETARDSAPAGSGYVSDEEIADLSRLLEEYAIAADTWADTKKLGKAAALLRKLQQGADSDEVMNAVRRYGVGYTNDEIRLFIAASQDQEKQP